MLPSRPVWNNAVYDVDTTLAGPVLWNEETSGRLQIYESHCSKINIVISGSTSSFKRLRGENAEDLVTLIFSSKSKHFRPHVLFVDYISLPGTSNCDDSDKNKHWTWVKNSSELFLFVWIINIGKILSLCKFQPTI